MVFSEYSLLLVGIVLFQVGLYFTQKVFFDFGWYHLSSFWEELFDEIFEIDFVEALSSDDFNAVLLQLFLPAAFNKLGSEVLLKSLFLATLFELLLDEALFNSDVLVLL